MSDRAQVHQGNETPGLYYGPRCIVGRTQGKVLVETDCRQRVEMLELEVVFFSFFLFFLLDVEFCFHSLERLLSEGLRPKIFAFGKCFLTLIRFIDHLSRDNNITRNKNSVSNLRQCERAEPTRAGGVVTLEKY